MKLSLARKRFLLRVDAAPYHVHEPTKRETRFVRRLILDGLLRRSRRFYGVTLTSLGSHAIGTFDFAGGL